MAEINKQSLKHSADLARLELQESEEQKFSADLQKILNYFKELQELNTENVPPMTGGTELKNVFREDKVFENDHFDDAGKIVEQFPDQKKGFLKVPPVFE